MLTKTFFATLIYGVVISTCKASVPPTEEYPHQAELDNDGRVVLYWNFDETHITFELHGNTTGWVGMGISSNGGMTGADIAVAWVKDGSANVTDRHGVGNTFPPIDPEQNIELIDGMELDGWTVIKFRRQLASCEPGYDMPITADTLRIIYAFGETDPQGSDITASDYHQTNRGARSLILLEPSGSENGDFPDGETHNTFDVLNDNFEIPSDTTYYNCRLHKLPEFNGKQHVVKVEPVIEPGNELFVHHMVVFQCTSDVNDSLHEGENVQCYSSNMPPDFNQCSTVIGSWAFGGAEMYYPSHAGLPLGDIDSPKYVVTETHYDNPRGLSGVVDSSGIRFTYTSQLRPYDAGVILSGAVASGTQHLIPPHAESFNSYGECSNSCLKQTMALDGIDKINVFAVMLHSHLVATGITVRQFRDNIEFPYLAKDATYDFNYQETRRFSEDREILPGDSLQVVCHYETKGVRQNMTVGGLTTEKEMCEAFLYYYPKISLSVCETIPDQTDLMSYFGIEETEYRPTQPGIYNDIYDLMIVNPEELSNQSVGNYLDAMPWNENAITEMEKELRNMKRLHVCYGPKDYIPGVEPTIPAPVVDVPYVEEEPVCFGETTTDTNVQTTTASIGDVESTTDGSSKCYSSHWTHLFAFIIVFIISIHF